MSDDALNMLKVIVNNQEQFKNEFNDFKKDVKIDFRDSRHELTELRKEMTTKLDKHVDDDASNFQEVDEKLDTCQETLNNLKTEQAKYATIKSVFLYVAPAIGAVGWALISKYFNL